MPSIVYVVYEAIGFRVPCSYCVETNAAAAAAHCLLGGGEGVEVGDALLEDGCFLGGCFGEDAGNNLVDEELLFCVLGFVFDSHQKVELCVDSGRVFGQVGSVLNLGGHEGNFFVQFKDVTDGFEGAC